MTAGVTPPLPTAPQVFLISCSFMGKFLKKFYVGASSWIVGVPSLENPGSAPGLPGAHLYE